MCLYAVVDGSVRDETSGHRGRGSHPPPYRLSDLSHQSVLRFTAYVRVMHHTRSCHVDHGHG